MQQMLCSFAASLDKSERFSQDPQSPVLTSACLIFLDVLKMLPPLRSLCERSLHVTYLVSMSDIGSTEIALLVYG